MTYSRQPLALAAAALASVALAATAPVPRRTCSLVAAVRSRAARRSCPRVAAAALADYWLGT